MNKTIQLISSIFIAAVNIYWHKNFIASSMYMYNNITCIHNTVSVLLRHNV